MKYVEYGDGGNITAAILIYSISIIYLILPPDAWYFHILLCPFWPECCEPLLCGGGVHAVVLLAVGQLHV